jgi:hypothetical protein
MAYIKHCQDTNYKSVDCQKLKEGCEGFDPTIAMVNPEGGDPCGINTDKIDTKELVLPCETIAKPVGPGTDPCLKTFTVTGYDPCSSSDPTSHYAMRDPDADPQAPKKGCPITVMSLPFFDLETPGIPCPPDEDGTIKRDCTISPPGSNPSGPGPK